MFLWRDTRTRGSGIMHPSLFTGYILRFEIGFYVLHRETISNSFPTAMVKHPSLDIAKVADHPCMSIEKGETPYNINMPMLLHCNHKLQC